MSTERSTPMMVLPMHVVCDGAAYGDVLSTRHHRQKPSVRYYETQDLGEQYSRLAGDPTLFAIEANDPIETASEQQPAPDIEATVAVAAPLPEGQHGLDHVRRGNHLLATAGRYDQMG